MRSIGAVELLFVLVIYYGPVLLVAYFVISALRRISAATENIAESMRRIDLRQPPLSVGGMATDQL